LRVSAPVGSRGGSLNGARTGPACVAQPGSVGIWVASLLLRENRAGRAG
jgi:hypothetical protein